MGWSGMYDLSNKVTCEQRSRSAGVSYGDTGGKNIPDRGNGTNTSKAVMCKVKRIVGGDEVRRGQTHATIVRIPAFPSSETGSQGEAESRGVT